MTVVVAETTHKRDQAGSKIFAALILPNILLILATLGLVYVGVRSGLAILTRLSDEIRRRSPNNLRSVSYTQLAAYKNQEHGQSRGK